MAYFLELARPPPVCRCLFPALLALALAGCSSLREYHVTEGTLQEANRRVAAGSKRAEVAVLATPVDGRDQGKPLYLRYSAIHRLPLVPTPAEAAAHLVLVEARDSHAQRLTGPTLLGIGLGHLAVALTALVLSSVPPRDFGIVGYYFLAPTFGIGGLELTIHGAILYHQGYHQRHDVAPGLPGVDYVAVE